MTLSTSAYVADFVANTPADVIPDQVLALGKRSILDGIGLALAGRMAASSRIVDSYLADLGCSNGTSSVLGSSLQLSPRFAAFANGVSIHADDYDDTQLAEASDRVYGMLTHPTAPVLPAVLALAEHHGRSGRDLLDAFVIGVEVECKVAEATDPRHYHAGFHCTGTVGTIGAAAGAARLLGHDTDTTLASHSIAASQAAGLRANFGTMTKPLHAGRAAESGVVAADLAGRGWTAASAIFEADRGFFHATSGGYEPRFIDGRLGSPWTFEWPGISIKPHPSGALTHPGMGLMLHLIQQHNIQARDVRCVRVGTNKNMPNALIHHQPTTELQAKFSMEFCIGILLIERRAGLAEFTDETVNRPDVQQIMKRIDFSVHPEAEADGYDKMTTIIDIELVDGRTITGRAEYGKGSPSMPMSDQELECKFYECAEWGGLPRDRAARVAACVWELEKLNDICELTALLRN